MRAVPSVTAAVGAGAAVAAIYLVFSGAGLALAQEAPPRPPVVFLTLRATSEELRVDVVSGTTVTLDGGTENALRDDCPLRAGETYRDVVIELTAWASDGGGGAIFTCRAGAMPTPAATESVFDPSTATEADEAAAQLAVERTD